MKSLLNIKSALITALLLVMGYGAHAAISGYYMSANEIKAILSSDEVYQKLGSAYPIDSIVRISNPTEIYNAAYEVTAKINTGQTCKLIVKAQYFADPAKPHDLPTLNLAVDNRICQ